jgi:Flp pilus assembly protein TadD
LHDEAIAAFEQARKLRPPDDPSTYGNLAWLFANSVDVKRRDPNKAVELATRAAELSPNSSFYLTALGVAQYRVGDWHRAVAALTKSDELPPSRSIECINALFLAMAHSSLANWPSHYITPQSDGWKLNGLKTQNCFASVQAEAGKDR